MKMERVRFIVLFSAALVSAAHDGEVITGNVTVTRSGDMGNQTGTTVSYTAERLSTNVTGALLPNTVQGGGSIAVSVLLTVTIVTCLAYGIVNAILANQEVGIAEPIFSSAQYVKSTSQKYGAMAKSTIALPTTAFLATLLFASALHNPSLWTAANILVGLSVLGARYIFESMKLAQIYAKEMSVLHGCYEVVAISLITQAVLEPISCRRYKRAGGKRGRLDQKLVLCNEEGFYMGEPRNPLPPYNIEYGARKKYDLLAVKQAFTDVCAENAVVNLFPIFFGRFPGAAWVAWFFQARRLTWTARDMTVEQQLIGKQAVKTIAIETRQIDYHLRNAAYAAKDEFLLTCDRYQSVLRAIVDHKLMYRIGSVWEIGDVPLMAVAQLFLNVEFRHIGWQMACERHIYRTLAKPAGDSTTSEFLTKLMIAIMDGGSFDHDPASATLHRRYGVHIQRASRPVTDLWMRYINVGLIFLDLIRMNQHVDLIHLAGPDVPRELLKCVRDGGYVGVTLTNERPEDVLKAVEHVKTSVYLMGDDQIHRIALALATVGVMVEISQTDIADEMNASLPNSHRVSIKAAIKLWKSQSKQDLGAYDRLINEAYKKSTDLQVYGPEALEGNIEAIKPLLVARSGDKMLARIFRTRNKAYVETLLHFVFVGSRRGGNQGAIEHDVDGVPNVRQTPDTGTWFSEVMGNIGLAVFVVAIYAAFRVNIGSSNSVWWALGDFGTILSITVVMYLCTWSSATRGKLYVLCQWAFAVCEALRALVQRVYVFLRRTYNVIVLPCVIGTLLLYQQWCRWYHWVCVFLIGNFRAFCQWVHFFLGRDNVPAYLHGASAIRAADARAA